MAFLTISSNDPVITVLALRWSSAYCEANHSFSLRSSRAREGHRHVFTIIARKVHHQMQPWAVPIRVLQTCLAVSTLQLLAQASTQEFCFVSFAYVYIHTCYTHASPKTLFFSKCFLCVFPLLGPNPPIGCRALRGRETPGDAPLPMVGANRMTISAILR